MKILVVRNPRSGRGASKRVQRRLLNLLTDRGHEVMTRDPAVGAASDTSLPADAMLLLGGDGTVLHAIPEALRTSTPIYHVPMGNENLFARACNMNRQVSDIVAAVERHRTRKFDLLRVGDHYATTMLSVGPDAGVIKRVAELRQKAIGHLAYAEPLLREAIDPTLPRLSVRVNGRSIVDRRRGLVVIANTRAYAMGLDPCPHAAPDDGRLHVAFFPLETRARAAGLFFKLYLLRGALEHHVARARGTDVELTLHDAGPMQADGELLRDVEAGETVRCHVEPGRLTVIDTRCP